MCHFEKCMPYKMDVHVDVFLPTVESYVNAKASVCPGQGSNSLVADALFIVERLLEYKIEKLGMWAYNRMGMRLF